MSLDNGIILKAKEELKVPFYVNIHKYPMSVRTYEICYWRKCWELRRRILNILGEKDNQNSYTLTPVQVKRIRRVLKQYLNSPTLWEENFWMWKEIKPTIRRGVRNLYWLELYMKKHKEAEVFFYDSF